jgi:transforming growth factor-beta-induced protein
MRPQFLAVASSYLFVVSSLAQSSAPSLEDVVADTDNLTSFSQLLATDFSDLVANLSSQQQPQQFVTLLAPSDNAFERLGSSSIFGDNSTDAIGNFLNYHVIPGNHPAATVTQAFSFFSTRLVENAYNNVTGGQRVGFVKQGNSEIIVISGGGTRSRVVKSDIYFNGGVMHVIDSPLLPPQPLIQAAIPFNLTGFLAAAYQNESAARSISEARDVTLFVPNNVAFERVGSTVTSIDELSLSSLIDYHVVVGEGGPFYTSSFSNGTIYKTRQGQNLTIRQASNSNFVNSARVLQADLLIANGVMHVIDNVLNPNGTGAVPDPAAAVQGPAMTGSSLADTPFTDIIPSLTSTLSIASSGTGIGAGTGTSVSGSGSTRRATSTRSSSTGRSTQGAAPRRAEASVRLMRLMGGVVLLCMGRSWSSGGC